MKLEEKVRKAVKKYLGTEDFEIKEITEEGPQESRGAFLVESKNAKIKAIVMKDENEFNNMTALSPLIKQTPKILHAEAEVVIVEWLEGETIKSEDLSLTDLKEVAKLQASIHSIPVKFNKAEIIEKFKKKIDNYIAAIEQNSKFTKEEMNKIKTICVNIPKNPRISIIHTDYNMENLLKTKNGWFSIDNELLQISLTGSDFGKPVNNICKNKEEIEEYVKAYESVSPAKFYTDNRRFYQLVYLIKQMSSRLRNKLPTDKLYKKIKEELKQ